MRGRCLPIFLLPVIFLSSCSPLHKHAGGIRHEDGQEAAHKASLQTRKRIEALIREENYSGALELIRAEGKRDESDTAYAEEFGESLNGLAEKAMQYFSEEDYESAGITLRLALDSYPPGARKPDSLRHSAEDLRALARVCAEKLKEAGLREYRDGNLGNAIALWRKILSFSNEGASTIKKMIETATLQLKNLKELKTQR
jgi:tetratricopeptide (TPR) repeat protein